ncbi:MAG TPA: hypothetical protein VGC41_21600 [Kofleriaceae bacterium]
MRALLVLVTACRIGFSDVPAIAIADAAPDAFVECAIDGTPCDDHNICTNTSSCVGGACVGAGGSCEVAHSMAEFGTTQGDNHWFYGFWDITDDRDGGYGADDFQELVFDGSLWRPPGWAPDPDPSFTWAYLAAWGGHPGSYPIQRAVVRRWVSPVAGDAIARVTQNKSDASGGDGTRAMLFVDGVQLLARDVAGTDSTGFVEDVPVTLAVGSRVDLLLHFIGDDERDTTNQALDVISR